MEKNWEAGVKTMALVVASAAYARLASSMIKPGKLRLLSLFPVVLLFPSFPFRFSSIILRGSLAFFLAWLGVFKLLLLASGVGPLSPSLPLSKFIAISSLPVSIRPANKPLSGTPRLVAVSCLQLLGLAVIIPLHRRRIHPWELLALNCSSIYLLLELLLGFAALVARVLLGLALEPQADAPFRSTSLQEFWGRRWNLMVTGILRPSVYRPVSLLCGTAAGVMAVFLVSGLMHEVMFYYLTFRPPTGEVTVFFLIHGVCTVAESRARVAGWWRVPEWPVVAVPLTLGFVGWTASWLFYPPLLRAGADEEGLRELAAALRWVADAGRAVFGPVTMGFVSF